MIWKDKTFADWWLTIQFLLHFYLSLTAISSTQPFSLSLCAFKYIFADSCKTQTVSQVTTNTSILGSMLHFSCAKEKYLSATQQQTGQQMIIDWHTLITILSALYVTNTQYHSQKQNPNLIYVTNSLWKIGVYRTAVWLITEEALRIIKTLKRRQESTLNGIKQLKMWRRQS